MNKEIYYNTKRRTWSPREMATYWAHFKGCRRVLDLACGIGLFGKYNPGGKEVYGIDIDEKALEQAKQYEKVIAGDAMEGLPYDNNFFDGVLMKDALEHVIYPWVVLKHVKRVLKPGGTVFATVPAPCKKAWDDYSHVRPFTKRAITELFLDQDYEVMSVKKIRGLPGFGKLGWNNVSPYILSIPGLGWLTQGYMIEARKKA
ncbi:MAG: class I SAM-dependent methyltransferase [archaeon]